MTHAPWVNLVTARAMSTLKEMTAPTALIAKPRRQPSSFSLRWCLAMPAWEHVKDVKTPMA